MKQIPCQPNPGALPDERRCNTLLPQNRITIPKWLQRGCMDPLDKICSLLVLRTVQLVQEEKQSQQQQQNPSEIEETSKRGLRSRQH